MKSLKILVTTLILGTSSLALAQPIIRDHRRADSDYRFEARRFRRIAPVTLATNMEVTLRRPAFVSLNGMTKLRFDADEGHAYIHSIVLRFSNGAQQTIDVRKRVTSRSMPLTVDIDSRATGVYVYGSTRGRGSLDVVGLRR